MARLTRPRIGPADRRGHAFGSGIPQCCCRVPAGGWLTLLPLLIFNPKPVLGQFIPPAALGEELRLPQQPVDTWLDRTQRGLHSLMWHTARTVDGWVGAPLDDWVYQQAFGSIAVAMLWDEYEGFDEKIRFHVDLPLPRINKRLHFFIGRVNPDEVVSERVEPEGTVPPLGRVESEEDETLAGLIYRRSAGRSGSFGASAGVSVRSSNLDPYVKASYRYQRALWTDTLLTLKETLFYRVSEEFGVTTRVDIERMINEFWRLRWTASASVSQASEGVRGYSSLTATRSLPGRRALIFRVRGYGETETAVPLRDFGLEVAYRTSVVRTWLVLELRTSLTWPKELPAQAREPSFGVGIGLEMYFGTDRFSSHPMMF